jgi:hypothetical protein
MWSIEPKGGERGAALVEQLIAVAILITAFSFAIQAIVDISKLQARHKAGALLFENDQLIRYEISGLLRTFQRAITEQNTFQQCRSPLITNTYKKIAKAGHATQTLVFGIPSAMATEPASTFPRTVSDAIAKLKEETRINGTLRDSANAKMIDEAYRRCNTNQSIRPGRNLQNVSSLYLCAFGENSMIEIKATFWDFNRSIPLLCQAMNSFPGRGSQVVFRAYHFAPGNNGFDDFPYVIKTSEGRIYIPKNIDDI